MGRPVIEAYATSKETGTVTPTPTHRVIDQSIVKVNGIVHISLMLALVKDRWPVKDISQAGTLPAGFRPKTQVYGMAICAYAPVYVYITTDGKIMVENGVEAKKDQQIWFSIPPFEAA